MNRLLDDVRRDAIARLREERKGRKRLIDAADLVLELCDIAQKQGLLSLEDAAENIGSEMLKKLILLIIDGTNPANVLEIGTNAYWIKAPKGVEAMRNYMYIRGAIGIEKGESRKVLAEIFLSLMPDRQRQEYEVLMDERKEESERMYRAEIEEKFPHVRPSAQDTEVPEPIEILEKEILGFPDSCVQRLVRDTDRLDLAVCVYGFCEEARKKLLDNLSDRVAFEVREKVVFRSPATRQEMTDSGNRILSLIRILKDRGEIIG